MNRVCLRIVVYLHLSPLTFSHVHETSSGWTTGRHANYLYLEVLLDGQAARCQHAVNRIECSGMVVALTALLTDFSFDIVYDEELLSEPMDLTDLLIVLPPQNSQIMTHLHHIHGNDQLQAPVRQDCLIAGHHCSVLLSAIAPPARD